MEEVIYRLERHTNRIWTKEEYIRDSIGGLPNDDELALQWESFDRVYIGENGKPVELSYDSTPDTLRHIKRVNHLLIIAACELMWRATKHDDSKLEGEEKALFDKYTPKLAGSTYGSEEYKQFLKDLSPALLHHYRHNSHHPEHYGRGIEDMNLFDILEMLLDWKAATERHNDGDIMRSIEINKDRFKISSQLTEVLRNTVNYLRNQTKQF